MTCTLHEELYMFLIIVVCRSVLLNMKKVSQKGCRETQRTFYNE
jgi:hypothetical protein